MINLAAVSEKGQFLLSNSRASHFSVLEFGGNQVTQEFVDTIEELRGCSGCLTVTSGIDFMRPAQPGQVQRGLGSAHTVILTSSGECIKACEAADIFPLEIDIIQCYNMATQLDFAGVGLYSSFKLEGFRFLHVDTMKNSVNRSKTPLYWYRESVETLPDGTLKPVYKYFTNAEQCAAAFKKFFSL